MYACDSGAEHLKENKITAITGENDKNIDC
jgi:hypothetical protein